MKRTTIHISAAIALLLGLAACTQDEAGFLPEGAEGTPIVFTATGLKPAATAIAIPEIVLITSRFSACSKEIKPSCSTRTYF